MIKIAKKRNPQNQDVNQDLLFKTKVASSQDQTRKTHQKPRTAFINRHLYMCDLEHIS